MNFEQEKKLPEIIDALTEIASNLQTQLIYVYIGILLLAAIITFK